MREDECFAGDDDTGGLDSDRRFKAFGEYCSFGGVEAETDFKELFDFDVDTFFCCAAVPVLVYDDNSVTVEDVFAVNVPANIVEEELRTDSVCWEIAEDTDEHGGLEN